MARRETAEEEFARRVAEGTWTSKEQLRKDANRIAARGRKVSESRGGKKKAAALKAEADKLREKAKTAPAEPKPAPKRRWI